MCYVLLLAFTCAYTSAEIQAASTTPRLVRRTAPGEGDDSTALGQCRNSFRHLVGWRSRLGVLQETGRSERSCDSPRCHRLAGRRYLRGGTGAPCLEQREPRAGRARGNGGHEPACHRRAVSL